MMTTYSYTKSPVSIERLTLEIQQSVITIVLDHITVSGTSLSIVFRDALPDDGTAVASVTCQTAVLDALVVAHTGAALPPSALLVATSDPKDADGSALVRTKTTKTGWHFEPRSLDYWTGVANSLYNRKSDNHTILGGDDLGDGALKFYDASGTLLVQDVANSETDANFQTRLDANCVETMMDWEPVYDYDILGAYIQMVNVPVLPEHAYMWTIIAPDIPANLGGSVPFCNGGWNLAFFANNSLFDVDGHGVKSMVYSATYHTSKVRMLIKHALAAKIGVQIIYKQYRA